MSLYEAKEKHPEYSLKFYNGSTLVGTVDSGGIVSIEITRNLIAAITVFLSIVIPNFSQSGSRRI